MLMRRIVVEDLDPMTNTWTVRWVVHSCDLPSGVQAQPTPRNGDRLVQGFKLALNHIAGRRLDTPIALEGEASHISEIAQ